jgi:hypothetical protein
MLRNRALVFLFRLIVPMIAAEVEATCAKGAPPEGLFRPDGLRERHVFFF